MTLVLTIVFIEDLSPIYKHKIFHVPFKSCHVGKNYKYCYRYETTCGTRDMPVVKLQIIVIRCSCVELFFSITECKSKEYSSLTGLLVYNKNTFYLS